MWGYAPLSAVTVRNTALAAAPDPNISMLVRGSKTIWLNGKHKILFNDSIILLLRHLHLGGRDSFIEWHLFIWEIRLINFYIYYSWNAYKLRVSSPANRVPWCIQCATVFTQLILVYVCVRIVRTLYCVCVCADQITSLERNRQPMVLFVIAFAIVRFRVSSELMLCIVKIHLREKWIDLFLCSFINKNNNL